MASPEAKVILTAVNRGAAAFKSFNAGLDSISGKAKIVGAAAAGALTLVTVQAFRNIDALAETADKLGIATDSLAELRLAASQTGVEQGKFDLGLQRMTRRLAELAYTGRGEAKPALDQLGLSIDAFIGKSPDEQFRIVADAMSQIENQSQRVAIGFKLFDAEGVDLIRTLQLGREGLDKYAEAARNLGISIDRVQAAKVELANEALDLATQAVKGLGNTIAIELAPLVTGIATDFLNVEGSAKAMGETVRGVIDGMAVAIGIVSDAFWGWRLIFAGLRVTFVAVAQDIVGAMATIQQAAINVKHTLTDAFSIDQAEIQQRIDEAKAALEGATLRSTRDRLEADIARLEQIRDSAPPALGEAQTASLREMADRLRETEDAMKGMGAELLASGPPSERLAAQIQQWRLDAEQAAAATAALRSNLGGGAEGGVPAKTPEQIAAEKAAETEKQRLEASLQREIEYLAKGEEAEEIATSRRRSILDAALAADIISDQRHFELKQRLLEDHNARIAEVQAERLVGNTMLTQQEITNEVAARAGAITLRQELERQALVTDLEIFRAALINKDITEEEFRQLSIDRAREAQDKLTEIEQAGYTERQKFAALSTKAQAGQVLGTLTQLTSGVANHNRRMFQLNKLAAIGNAVVNTAEAVTTTLKAYPAPINFALAAAVAAAGLVQIQAIKSASFGGGTTPSVAGSTPTLNNTPLQSAPTVPDFERSEARKQTIVNVNINGPVAGPGGVEDLIDIVQDGLRDRLENRDEVIFSSNSRQAAAVV